MNILTDEDIFKINEGFDNPYDHALEVQSAVVEKLKADGWVQLKPGQVVAEWKCRGCGAPDGNFYNDGSCMNCGQKYPKQLVEEGK
jgi:hypothetical protein